MNGARTTYMRGGWLLTALAAVALLAASPGTASAQNTTGVTITGPALTVDGKKLDNTVMEGSSAVYTVEVNGVVPVAANTTTPTPANRVTVTLGTPTPDSDPAGTTGDAGDLNINQSVLQVRFDTPPNASTTEALPFTGSKEITLLTIGDTDAEDEHFSLTFTLAPGNLQTTAGTNITLATAGGAYHPNVLILKDDEEQTYVMEVSKSSTPTEGGQSGQTPDVAATIDIKAVPPHEDDEETFNVYVKPADGSGTDVAFVLSGDTATVSSTSTSGQVTVTQTGDDKNRITDKAILTLYEPMTAPAPAELQDTLEIEFADANLLPKVKVEITNAAGTVLNPQPSSVKEGASVHVRATALGPDGKTAANATEELKVKLAAGGAGGPGAADARDILAPGELTIANGSSASPADAALELTMFGPDEDVGVEVLTLDAVVSGEDANGKETSTVAGVLTLDIVDTTSKYIWPLDQDVAYPKITAAIDAGDGDDNLLNPEPQESFTVDASELFGNADGYTVSYGTSVEGDAVSWTASGANVTVTAEKEGDAKVTITGTAKMASSSFMPDQDVSNVASITFDVEVRDSALSVTPAADPSEVDEGGTSEITVTANRMVTAADGAVEIDLLVVGAATLDSDSITIAEGSNSGSATLTTEADDDTDDETVTVVASGSGITDNISVEIAVTDTTDAPAPMPTVRAVDGASGMIAAAITAAAGDAEWMVGGSAASVDMSELFEADEGVTVRYSGESSDESVVSASVSGGTMLSLAPKGAGSATITVTGSDPDGGSVATVEHEAMVALQTLTVTVTASAEEVDEGGSVTLTAAANRAVTADVVLQVTVTGDAEAVSADDNITISMGEKSGTATVEAVEDDDTANANVELVVSGSALDSPQTFSLAVTDNDRTVTALAQASVDALFAAAVTTAAGSGGMWLPGGNDATVDMSALFEIEDGASVEYKASSSNEDAVTASASGSSLSLSPAGTGESTIMVTATDTNGDADDTASVSSKVAVGVLPLVVTLKSPADAIDGNIVEGKSYDIMVEANRAVTADTPVMISRDRSLSEADDSDFTVEDATIKAGESTATATLMVTEDNMDDAGHGMGEELVLYGMVDGEEINSLKFTIWDQAVPALPLIAQLLLALFLMAGGSRLYRRRQG